MMTAPKSDSQILQDFVENLLKEPGVEFDAPNVEHSQIDAELIEPTLVLSMDDTKTAGIRDSVSVTDRSLKLSIPEIKISAASQQPLLSEKLLRAKTLLKTMPDVSDVIQHPEMEVVLPEVMLADNLLNDLLVGTSDDIIITENKVIEIDKDAKLDAEFKVNQQSLLKTNPNTLQTSSFETSQQQDNQPLAQIQSPLKDGIPDWGRGRFQSLIFRIGELKLAVPLVKLGGIHRMEPKPTPMPENPDWYLGLIGDELGNISVIDTALWIMPEKYDIAKAKGLDYKFFVLLDDSRWGLACSRVENAITLSEEDIRWNRKASKRPWLAGMVVEEMCALIDVETLLMMLEGAQTNHSTVSS